ncbi:ParB N-terminal domain-containing protein [Agrobacterium pusense]|uniref:ParB N-terminal domain-containing protein n=1 Tax=Agrobacterium pusense TaxID=648995 RepID=A0A6H0ZMN0_9HYPH|nr:ParB N-terminal domain-containing protein [Agrobacterium pusense]QIX21453.1 ParB N-terminal domain-containing protein [Agrobacterium pusense]
MNRRLFPIEDIFISKKRRAPDMARVNSIAESIGDVGLMNPPAVCIRNDFTLHDGEVSDAVPVLIYGHHRLLALKQRGEVAVECIVYAVDDLHAELMEIDENLARSELTPAEESAYILRRKQIWEEMHQSGKNFPIESKREDGRGHRQTEFASEVAEVTGASKRDVNLKIARARELGQDIHRIVGTSLDKGVEMDALIKLPKSEQSALIERAEAGEKVSARPTQDKPVSALEAMAVIAPPAQDRKAMQRQKFWEMWASLDDDVRQEIAAVITAKAA